MAGLADTLTANGKVQGEGKTMLQVWDTAVSAMADAAGFGEAIGIVDTIIGFFNPPAGSSQPTLDDLKNQFDQFSSYVSSKLDAIQKTDAGGLLRTWKQQIDDVLEGPDHKGLLPTIREIPRWKETIGLPLPDRDVTPSPSDCHILARGAVEALLGGGGLANLGSN